MNILIPKNYRLVKEGEILKKGDYYITHCYGSQRLADWTQDFCFGTAMGKVGSGISEWNPRIRKIEKTEFTKNFQVNTEGSVEVKKMLVDLFEKHTSAKSFPIMTSDSIYDYIQFWVTQMPDGDCNGETCDVTHNETPYKPHLVEVVSVPEAVKRIKSYKKFVPVQVSLNGNHDAEIQEDGSVKVGCQTFDARVVIGLADEVKKVLKKS